MFNLWMICWPKSNTVTRRNMYVNHPKSFQLPPPIKIKVNKFSKNQKHIIIHDLFSTTLNHLNYIKVSLQKNICPDASTPFSDPRYVVGPPWRPVPHRRRRAVAWWRRGGHGRRVHGVWRPRAVAGKSRCWRALDWLSKIIISQGMFNRW